MYYPAGFAWWYGLLVWLTSGSEMGFLVIHSITHSLSSTGTWLLFEEFVPSIIPAVFLALGAQNIFRTEVSRLTNDTFLVPLFLLLAYGVKHRYALVQPQKVLAVQLGLRSQQPLQNELSVLWASPVVHLPEQPETPNGTVC